MFRERDYIRLKNRIEIHRIEVEGQNKRYDRYSKNILKSYMDGQKTHIIEGGAYFVDGDEVMDICDNLSIKVELLFRGNYDIVITFIDKRKVL